MKEYQFQQFKNELPEKPDIYGREEYLNSAVLVPFVLLDGEYHLLFQKRAPGISQGSEICFPGGHHDEQFDGSFKDTAVRETVEELGVESGAIRIIGRLDMLVTPRGVIVEPFVGILDIESLENLQPDANEVEEIFTLPVSWFIENKPEIYYNRVQIQSSYINKEGEEQVLLPVDELGLPSFYRGTRGGWKYRVVVYKTRKHIIWGLTASVVFSMMRIIEEMHKKTEKPQENGEG